MILLLGVFRVKFLAAVFFFSTFCEISKVPIVSIQTPSEISKLLFVTFFAPQGKETSPLLPKAPY